MLFVTIRQVHKAIAEGIEIPVSEIDAFELAKLPETETIFGFQTPTFGVLGREAFINNLRHKFSQSEAALKLDQVLNFASHFGMPLHWMDGRETGKLKVNPNAADDLLPALVDLGKHFARCRKEHFEGNHILSQRLQSLWELLDPKRLDEVGFIAEQLTPILAEAGIAHSSFKLQEEEISDPSHCIDKSDSSSLTDVSAERTQRAETTLAVVGDIRVHLTNDSKSFEMDDLIVQIVEHVRKTTQWTPGSRGNHARFFEAVWNQLVNAAKQGAECEPSLIGYDEKANIVRYRSLSGWSNMSLERLRGKLRSKFKGVLTDVK